MSEDQHAGLLDDNPTEQDTLGVAPVADVLFDLIVSASSRPLTIGVFGGWGSGKTSLMKMVQRQLIDVKVKTVWFNAWKYDGKEVIWNALIQTIFLEMKNDPDIAASSRRDEFKNKVIHTSIELAKYAAKVGTRFVPGGILREEDVEGILKALRSSAEDPLFDFVNRFETEFDALVTEYVGEPGYLVVFIDDLDRCLPENAIQVMEALKLYLDKANCVFVVGAEPAVIEEAIDRRYGGNPSLSPTDYLEKIIQVPFVLPRIRTEKILALTEPVLGSARWAKNEDMLRLVRIGLNRNPRRIKRFANTFTIALRVDGAEASTNDQLVLAKIIVLQMRFPAFYRKLVQDPGLLEKLKASDSAAWKEAGVGELRDNAALVQFLARTQGIRAEVSQVRRWVRTAAGPRAGFGDVFEDDATDGA